MELGAEQHHKRVGYLRFGQSWAKAAGFAGHDAHGLAARVHPPLLARAHELSCSGSPEAACIAPSGTNAGKDLNTVADEDVQGIG